jgi:uncharacterized protein YggE
LFLGTASQAQQSGEKAARSIIRVTGEATVSAKPDQASIDVGVTTQASTAQQASTDNATRLDATLAELKKLLGPSADIKTVSYSVSPNYRYPREGGQPTITGYTATNIVRIKTGDLSQVGKLIDTATQNGSNTIHALRFSLKDESALRNRALAEAATKARAKAEAIASALGLKIVRVLQVEEGGGGPRPVPYAMAEASVAARAPTPVETGTLDITATVTLTVEIAQ